MIQDGDTGVLTGGSTESPATTKVSRYSRSGLEKYLPSLNTGRYRHGCSSLEIGEKIVSQALLIMTFQNDILTWPPIQAYVVVGGLDISNNRLASTELLITGEAAWKRVGPLPVAVRDLRATTVQNIVYATGE